MLALATFVVFAAVAQSRDVGAFQFAPGGIAGIADGDPVVGGYLAARWPTGELLVWGADLEGLYAPEGMGDFLAAAQAVLEWPLHSRVAIPENFGIWLGARAGVLAEADRLDQTASSATGITAEAYPTAGLIATGVWSPSSRVGLEVRVTLDALAAVRLALGLGVRFR
jgi:hypothetical protein